MAEPSPGDRALALLLRLVTHASWYNTAIELDAQVDGEDAQQEAESILIDAGLLEEAGD